jgi:hypothetical protein
VELSEVDSPEKFFAWFRETPTTVRQREFKKLVGYNAGGMMLERIAYWWTPDKHGQTRLRVKKKDNKGKPKYYFVRDEKGWYEELGLTEKQVRTANNRLRQRGFVTTEKRRFNCKTMNHYRLNVWNLVEAIHVAMDSQNVDMDVQMQEATEGRFPSRRKGASNNSITNTTYIPSGSEESSPETDNNEGGQVQQPRVKTPAASHFPTPSLLDAFDYEHLLSSDQGDSRVFMTKPAEGTVEPLGFRLIRTADGNNTDPYETLKAFYNDYRGDMAEWTEPTTPSLAAGRAEKVRNAFLVFLSCQSYATALGTVSEVVYYANTYRNLDWDLWTIVDALAECRTREKLMTHIFKRGGMSDRREGAVLCKVR